MKKADLTGQRSGKLLALWPAGWTNRPDGKRSLLWLCQCDCGEMSLMRVSPFRRRKHTHCRHNLRHLLKGADYHRYWKHRMLPATFQALLKSQDGKCAICHDSLDDRCHIDHDHSCCGPKKSCPLCRRGILCHACNTGIGKFKENPSILHRAIEYLELHKP